ncbi:cytidine deaminase [Streptosporangium sp. 'caverna']|uniref:cytidine deaminase n=1 Tax=Streptosporangium sp. 'caverna' TaxID=2202249 RepID=UPI000D7E0D4E|nr:cytidine deaminase [Streptosporangium sp. 'caverna']AWS42552.1 cytidine deaminase [Streptosporangium sp. 'caverna']
MYLDQRLVDAAIDQMDRRWPADEQGGAAAVYLDDGEILTSVGFDNLNGGVSLCQETGAICQAYTLNRKVTASVCVCRIPGREQILVLPPCGICQERLALWGPDVEVGVPDRTSPAGWCARTLREVNPFYWGSQFTDDGAWPPPQLHYS